MILSVYNSSIFKDQKYLEMKTSPFKSIQSISCPTQRFLGQRGPKFGN